MKSTARWSTASRSGGFPLFGLVLLRGVRGVELGIGAGDERRFVHPRALGFEDQPAHAFLEPLLRAPPRSSRCGTSTGRSGFTPPGKMVALSGSATSATAMRTSLPPPQRKVRKLHRFAARLLADDHRVYMRPQHRGDHLGSPRSVAIDEHDDDRRETSDHPSK